VELLENVAAIVGNYLLFLWRRPMHIGAPSCWQLPSVTRLCLTLTAGETAALLVSQGTLSKPRGSLQKRPDS
jgi:hypothetical protein